MLIVERQQRVLEILRERKAAQLEDLARALDVSGSTIRRDLEALERRGMVERTHGGAIYKGDVGGAAHSNGGVAPGAAGLLGMASARGLAEGGRGQDNAPSSMGQHSPVLAERMNQDIEQKIAIGRYAAAQITPHMTVLLDGGSTVIFAAKEIKARPLQIVTHSLSIANLFADDDQIELLLLGGNLYPRTGVTVGAITTGCLADLYADLAIFSVAGIFDDAAFNINLPMAQVEQLMIRQATRSLLLMDSSKFGRKSLVRVCGLNEVDQIVTDAGIGPNWQQSVGERLVVVDSKA